VTPLDYRLLRTIAEWIDVYRYAPSLRELGDARGVTSSSVISAHLSTLVEIGYVQREPHKARVVKAVLVTGGRNDVSDATAGALIAALDREQPQRVMHGAARGVDTLAARWAQQHDIAELRELMVGIWARLEHADRVDHIRELQSYQTDREGWLSDVASAISRGVAGENAVNLADVARQYTRDLP
jgi:DNA-binding MarR family transcriptional regulator